MFSNNFELKFIYKVSSFKNIFYFLKNIYFKKKKLQFYYKLFFIIIIQIFNLLF